jgi:hypothetical protein
VEYSDVVSNSLPALILNKLLNNDRVLAVGFGCGMDAPEGWQPVELWSLCEFNALFWWTSTLVVLFVGQFRAV